MSKLYVNTHLGHALVSEFEGGEAVLIISHLVNAYNHNDPASVENAIKEATGFLEKLTVYSSEK